MLNNLHSGSVRYVVFKDDGVWYAAGLEFNIVESGDEPRIALLNLFDALTGYVESLKKIKGGRVHRLLNQRVSREYEALWSVLHSKKPENSPFEVSTFGQVMV